MKPSENPNANVVKIDLENVVETELDLDEELTLDQIISNPILERVAKRMEDEVITTSHTAHNSHYSSNS